MLIGALAQNWLASMTEEKAFMTLESALENETLIVGFFPPEQPTTFVIGYRQKIDNGIEAKGERFTFRYLPVQEFPIHEWEVLCRLVDQWRERQESVKSCKFCHTANSPRWWKCCPVHTTEQGTDTVCTNCMIKLHPRRADEIDYIPVEVDNAEST